MGTKQLLVCRDVEIQIQQVDSGNATRAWAMEIRNSNGPVCQETPFFWQTMAERPPRFRTLAADRSPVLAVVEASRPREVLLLYDRDTGELFPADSRQYAVGRKLLDRLCSALQDDRYVLTGDFRC